MLKLLTSKTLVADYTNTSFENAYDDIAIPISWPDKTAYGDEKWMLFLKKLGVIKNLHFRVGHAGILLIETSSGTIRYFDFGRYLCPRGYGRARSEVFDRRLSVDIQARISDGGQLTNIREICEELAKKEVATHGGGRMFFSVCTKISYLKSVAYAERLVTEGPIRYGAFAQHNNSCSRFVAQILVAGMEAGDKRRRKIFYPECLKASPTSNVINAAPSGDIYCFSEGGLQSSKMNRKDSILFQFDLLKDNFTSSGAAMLESDEHIGMIEAPLILPAVPIDAQWIGGIGEGAWFHLEKLPEDNRYAIQKIAASGDIEYRIVTTCDQDFRNERSYHFTHHFTYSSYLVVQEGNCYVFKAII